jgi:hypothetical protein
MRVAAVAVQQAEVLEAVAQAAVATVEQITTLEQMVL